MKTRSKWKGSWSGVRHWPGLAALLAILCGIAGAGIWFSRQPKYPGTTWSRKPPEKAGFSAAKLAEFSSKAGSMGCVVHGGEIIHEWGDIASRTDVASAAKPIYAYLLLKAIETGRLASLDEKVVRWMPELAELNPELGHPGRRITFRHLLGQTSGYGLAEGPGRAFAYNDYATGLLVHILFEKIYGVNPRHYNELLNGPLLGEALGFEDAPTAYHFRSRKGRIRISIRDLARFALLYLRAGVWRGRQVLREDLFRLAMSEPLPPDFPRTSGVESEHLDEIESIGDHKNEKGHAGCLGFFWWVNRVTPDGSRLLPDAPPRTFVALGYGGRTAMVIVPELDLIAIWRNIPRSDRHRSPFDVTGRLGMNDWIRDLLAARIRPSR